MSGSSHNHSQSPGPRQGEPSSSRAPRSRSPQSNLPPMRYVGDGLDFRRPAMSSSQQEPVIDLTNEPDLSPQRPRRRQRTPSRTAPLSPRPPRFERNILAEPDVVDLLDEPDSARNQDRESPTSPEVQFVRATSRRRPRPQPLPGPRPMSRSSVFNMMRRALPAQWLPLDWDLETIFIGDRGGPDIDVTLDLDVPLAREPAPPRSTYKPPSPAPEGFTRSFGEDELVVCPNCETELGTGDEQKRQTWVARPCGHVRLCLPSCTVVITAFADTHRCIAANVPKTALSRSRRNRKTPNPFPNAR